MHHDLINIITTGDPEVRNRSLDGFCRDASAETLLEAVRHLDHFRRESQNLYERVRATFFLSAIYRYHLPLKLSAQCRTRIPYEGFLRLLSRRFEEAVDEFIAVQEREGPSDGIASALAAAYHALAFQLLSDQVRRSVRSVRGSSRRSLQP
jgi:hypothetical protein